ncbi:MAG: TonB-dependent receptor [Acidobacteriota bacterium]
MAESVRAFWIVSSLFLVAGYASAGDGPVTALSADGALDASDAGYTESVEVQGRAGELVGVADSANQGSVGAVDLARRPILRPGELLEAVPGVIITQHSGSGKANQYFLRGFNLDHGTDFRVSVDGMPVNMPSHGHGQGYADLNFMIPELVAYERFNKGPYDAHQGDFSAAGSVEMELMSQLPKGIFSITPGADGYRRALLADSFRVGGGDLLIAGEWLQNDGPWVVPDAYHKLNGLVRYSRNRGGDLLSLTAMAYDGRWNSTDQIPTRAVRGGALDRFGSLDDSDGGDSSRFSLSGGFRHVQGKGITNVSAYLIDYDLQLFSNFTYFLDDPINGDQFRQRDDRLVSGVALTHTRAVAIGSREFELSGGLQVRRDDIDNSLAKTRRRDLLSVTRADSIQQYGGGVFAEARTKWTPWLRTVTGVRVDGYRASVDSDRAANSGTASDSLLSPKLSVAFGPWHATELYLNAGYGYHSNDARGTTIRVDPVSGDRATRVAPLVRAKGLDLGVRTEALPELQSSLTAFALELDSELVFVGDAGTTEASRPSRRVGVEWANFWTVRPGVSVDFDLALSRGRFTDNDPSGDRIPGSIERAITAGITLSDQHKWSGALRVRHFGPRPLIEDNTTRSQSSTLLYAEAGYTLRDAVKLSLQAFNLLNETVSDIDYLYESRLQGEAAPIEDVHFHPAEPRQLRLVVDWRF